MRIRIPNTATKTLRIKNQIYIALGPVCALFCTLSVSLPYSSRDGTAPPCNPSPPCSRSPGSSLSQASTNPSAGEEAVSQSEVVIGENQPMGTPV
jgi:hypothetical protein